ncbi:MAG: methyltransferase domain-containing protein [Deltaproteobacteria bacterium]|nr:methyltransferase domain-containing protein [Deltaproteobacteria bacterium]
MTADVFSEEFWAGVWQGARDSSILQTTQKSDPSRWLAFYDHVSAMWLEMMGEGWVLAGNVTRLLLQNGLVGPGKSVLDVGCGPGALAISLAEQGARVTALDSSRKMLDCLMSEGLRRGVQGIKPVLADWSRYASPSCYDFVVAAFFPHAMTPSGIKRLEILSKGCCALVTGCGKEAFPIRGRLWRRLMDESMPQTGRHLSCAFNYLLTSGRSPNLMHLSWPINVNLPMDTVIDYYRHYFEIFGRDHQAVDEAIHIEMAEYVQDNCYRSSGEMDVALIWWQPQIHGIRADERLNPLRLSCWHF